MTTTKIEFIQSRLKADMCVFAISDSADFEIVKVPIEFDSLENGVSVKISSLPKTHQEVFKKIETSDTIQLFWNENYTGFLPKNIQSYMLHYSKYCLAWSFGNAITKRYNIIQTLKKQCMIRYEELVILQNANLKQK